MQDHTGPAPRGFRIGLVGTFDVANYGDCVFPLVYMHMLDQRLPGCEYSFYSPRALSAKIMEYGPIKALPATLDDLHFDADTLILCGGETLWLGHNSGTYNFPANTLSGYARLWLGPTVAASRGDVRFYVHSVGLPTHIPTDQPEIERVLRSATRVSLRDTVSARRLAQTFPVEVDPVFSLSTMKSPEDWKKEAERWLPSGIAEGEYLCAHISMPYLSNGIAPWCEAVFKAATQLNAPVLLTPICHFMEDRAAMEYARTILIELGMDQAKVKLPLEGCEHVMATAALLGNAKAIMTSSLHAAVSAASFAVPFAVFVGAGNAEGKHRQTLRAAGVDFGTSTTIEGLPAVLEEALTKPMASYSAEAIRRAAGSADALAKDIAEAAGPPRPIAQEHLKAVLSIDRAATRQLSQEAKRVLLRMLNRSSIVAAWLSARRRNRILKQMRR